MKEYKNVPVPSQLANNPDDIQSHWWQRGVRDCLTVVRTDLADSIELVCQVADSVDVGAHGLEIEPAQLVEAMAELRNFRAGE